MMAATAQAREARLVELRTQTDALVKAIKAGPVIPTTEPERLIFALTREFGAEAVRPTLTPPGQWKWRTWCVRDPRGHGFAMTIRTDPPDHGMRLSCGHGCLPADLEASARELERWKEPPPKVPATRRTPLRWYPSDEVVRELRRLDPLEYVPRLSGIEISAHGRSRCPFHGGTNRQAFSIKGKLWTCFNCGRTGSSAIDFASLLWGLSPTGPTFVELKDRLARELLGRAA